MSNYVSVIFCRKCRSRYVEISEWSEGGAVINCRSCGNRLITDQFTLGRTSVSGRELQEARDSLAKTDRYEQ